MYSLGSAAARNNGGDVAGAQEMFDLSGKVAVLTGVGSGIGKGERRDVGGSRCDDRRRRHRRGGAGSDRGDRRRWRKAVVQRTDVTQRPMSTPWSTAPRRVRPGRHRRQHRRRAAQQARAECTDEEFERLLAINLKSVFYGCQAAIRHMVPQGSGCIVNISSGAIDTPAPTLACYGMTKAAVAMLTKTLATEVGRHGIRVERDRARHDPHELLAPQLRRRGRQRRPREARAVPQAGKRWRRSGVRGRRRMSPTRSCTSCPTRRASSPVRSSARTAAWRCPGRCGGQGVTPAQDPSGAREPHFEPRRLPARSPRPAPLRCASTMRFTSARPSPEPPASGASCVEARTVRTRASGRLRRCPRPSSSTVSTTTSFWPCDLDGDNAPRVAPRVVEQVADDLRELTGVARRSSARDGSRSKRIGPARCATSARTSSSTSTGTCVVSAPPSSSRASSRRSSTSEPSRSFSARSRRAKCRPVGLLRIPHRDFELGPHHGDRAAKLVEASETNSR